MKHTIVKLCNNIQPR